MARDSKNVSIIADNVAHVRPLPDGLTEDDVKQDFWDARADKRVEAKAKFGRGETTPGYTPPTAPMPESPEIDPSKYSGEMDCPYCGKHYKRVDMHMPRCEKGTGGKY